MIVYLPNLKNVPPIYMTSQYECGSNSIIFYTFTISRNKIKINPSEVMCFYLKKKILARKLCPFLNRDRRVTIA
jgi:hypothetical protein